MNICFILPHISTIPRGGFRVVYDYANAFAARGHKVFICYPYIFRYRSWILGMLAHPIGTIKYFSSYLGMLITGKLRERNHGGGGGWHSLDSRVSCRYPFQLAPWLPFIYPRGTRFIATMNWTSIAVSRFWCGSARKFYFIQGYENWAPFDDALVKKTYSLKLKKVAISKWLCEKVAEADEKAVCIPNGLDFQRFSLRNPIEGRNRYEIAMLWHPDGLKRANDSLQALRIVHERFPNVHLTSFGVPERPDGWPEWITYVKQPDAERHNRIYNEAAIFVASSEQEGWGLCPSEAMICGAALACTDIGGYRSFAENGVNALMSPVYDVEALADNVCRLIEDNQLRIRIAKAGAEGIKKFTIESAVDKFLSVLGGDGYEIV